MHNIYLEKITKLLAQARPKLAMRYGLEFKNCFGAVAGYVQGKIFISCGTFGIALKLPPKTLTILFKQKDTKHLRYFPHGHIKKEYAILPERIIKNRHALGKLMDESVTYVLS